MVIRVLRSQDISTKEDRAMVEWSTKGLFEDAVVVGPLAGWPDEDVQFKHKRLQVRMAFPWGELTMLGMLEL